MFGVSRAGKVLGSLEAPQIVVMTALTIESIGNPTK
jgi:hypothetical protein